MYLNFEGNFTKPILEQALRRSLFLENFKEQIKDCDLFPRIWIRYMDDVFAVMRKNNVQRTLKMLNETEHTPINFTVEEEKDNGISFLDVWVSKEEDGRLAFKVFRKPTSTKRKITCDSHHTFAQKMTAYHNMAHRLVNFPMKCEDYNRELQTIIQIAEVNGYRIFFLILI